MSKTAAIILNHNLPEWTDRLYKALKPYEREDYDTLIFDNGSKEENVSKHTSFRSEENLYFGGGFHAGMQVVLEDDQYDSMLFLNNDLTVFGYNFVKTLRREMFGSMRADLNVPCLPLDSDIIYDIVSPTFYNVEPDGQCFWKTMHGYGSPETRSVPYVDFQCPLISKRILKEIDQIDASLMYGFGIDFFFALTCQDKGWKLGVLDRLCVLHHNSMTVKTGVAGLNIQQYCQKAEAGQYEFFNNVIKRQYDYQKLRQKAESYSFP